MNKLIEFVKESDEFYGYERDRVWTLSGPAERMKEEINSLPESRAKSIALTKLEECLMWATVAAIG